MIALGLQLEGEFTSASNRSRIGTVSRVRAGRAPRARAPVDLQLREHPLQAGVQETQE